MASLAPDGPLGLAVSGGPDSMALLGLCAMLEREILVLSVDHGLRPEAADETAMVARWCAARSIPHEILHWSPPAKAQGTLSEQARGARYRLLAEACVRRGVPCLAVAHHADDQAETVLMRLARGAGVTGVAGIASCRPLIVPQGSVALIRPLLEWRKEELIGLADHAGWPHVIDPTNSNPSYDRVRARDFLATHREIAECLLAARREASDLSRAMAQRFDRLTQTDCQHSYGTVFVGADGFRGLGPVLQRHFLSFLCRAFNPGRHAPGRKAVAALADQLRSGDGNATLAGLIWVPVQEGFWVGRESRAAASGVRIAPGESTVWDSQWRIKAGARSVRVGPVSSLGGEEAEDVLRDHGVPRALWPAIGMIGEGSGQPGFLSAQNAQAGAEISHFWPESAANLPLAFL